MQVFTDFFEGLFGAKYIEGGTWSMVADGLVTTLMITAFAVVLGTLFGLLLCACRRAKLPPLRIIYGIFSAVFTGVPVAIMIFLVFGAMLANVEVDAVLVCIIIFALYFSLQVARELSDGLDGVDRGQYEAADALGYTKIGGFLNVILPQALRCALPEYRMQIITLLKATSIVGLVVAPELFYYTRYIPATIAQSNTNYGIEAPTQEALYYLLAALIYLAIVWLVIFLLRLVERQLSPSNGRKAVR